MKMFATAIAAALLLSASPVKPKTAVGFTIIDFKYKDALDKERTLTTAVWYPSEGEEKDYEYGGGHAKGKIVFDGKVAPGGPYPLVVYSHGYSGGGVAAVFLTEHLARLGFVVAAPDYDDDVQAVRIRGGAKAKSIDVLRGAGKLIRQGTDLDRKAYSYRPTGLRATIDEMLRLSAAADGRFKGAIDKDKIGVVGHSFGSFTSFAVLGANAPDKDARVKAGVCLSGGLFPYKTEEFKNVGAPVIFIYGEKEAKEDQGKRMGRENILDETKRAYGAIGPPKYMLEVKDGSHFTFTERVRKESDEKTAAEQIRVINMCAGAFLLSYVKGDASAEEVLTKDDPWLTANEHQIR